jgi:hypothetical protein
MHVATQVTFRDADKTGGPKPVRALSGGGVKPFPRLEHDVQAGLMARERVRASGVNHGVVDDYRAADRDGDVCLRDQFASLGFPVAMQHVAKADHMGGRQWSVVHVTGDEAEPVAQCEGFDVFLEDRSHGGEVVARAGQVRVSQGDAHGQRPLRRSDVDE